MLAAGTEPSGGCGSIVAAGLQKGNPEMTVGLRGDPTIAQPLQQNYSFILSRHREPIFAGAHDGIGNSLKSDHARDSTASKEPGVTAQRRRRALTGQETHDGVEASRAQLPPE
jgi:hypothetical protein